MLCLIGLDKISRDLFFSCGRLVAFGSAVSVGSERRKPYVLYLYCVLHKSYFASESDVKFVKRVSQLIKVIRSFTYTQNATSFLPNTYSQANDFGHRLDDFNCETQLNRVFFSSYTTQL